MWTTLVEASLEITRSIRDFVVRVNLVGFVMCWVKFKDSKMSLYWRSMLLNYWNFFSSDCSLWIHFILDSNFIFLCFWIRVCLTNVFKTGENKISIKTWKFLSYILQLKSNKRLTWKFLVCGSQRAVTEDIVIKQHLLRQKIYQGCLVQVVHRPLFLSDDKAVH